MTIPSALSRADYNGDDITNLFVVPFRFLENTHLQVLRTVIATNESTTLVLDSVGPDGYTVTGAGQPSGGQVHVVTAPAVGERLSILRSVPRTQLTDYIPNDSFPAESHERALDKWTMILQELGEVIDRAVVLSPQTTGVSNQLPGPEALKLLRWKPDLTGLENADPPEIATVADGAVVDATVSPIAAIQSTKLSFLQSGTDAVARTVQAKDREWVTPGDRGALGDGVTDDGAAFTSAIANGDFHVPPGTYLIGSNLSITSNTTFAAGAKLKPDAGVTITVSGAVETGDTAIFDLSAGGSVVLSQNARIARLAWFGMSPTETAANNTAAFNAAIAACHSSNGQALVFPAGTLSVNSLVVNKSGVGLSGHRAGTWLVNNAANAPAIDINGGEAQMILWCSAKNLRIGQAAAVAAGLGNCGIRIRNADQVVLDDVVCFQFPGALHRGFVFENAADFSISKLVSLNCINDGFYFVNTPLGFTDGSAHGLFSFSNAGAGFFFSGCSGMFMSNLHAYGNGTSAFHFSGATALNQFFFGTGWIADTSASHNWLVQNLNRSSFSDCWGSTQISTAVNPSATGMTITGATCHDLGFTNCHYFNNNSQGVTVTSSATNISFSNCFFGGVSPQGNGQSGAGAGIRLELCSDVTVTNCRARSNASQGFVATAVASDYLMVQNNNFRGNTGASLTNSSTGLNNQVGTNIV